MSMEFSARDTWRCHPAGTGPAPCSSTPGGDRFFEGDRPENYGAEAAQFARKRNEFFQERNSIIERFAMQQVFAERILPRRSILVDASLIIWGSLFVAALAQLSIPLQPVPVTGQTFAVLLVGMVLGSRRGALALAAYLAEGLAGLPAFAEARAGPRPLVRPPRGVPVG